MATTALSRVLIAVFFLHAGALTADTATKALNEEIPHNSSAAEIEAILARASVEATPTEQRLLKNGLAWMEEHLAAQPGKATPRERLHAWLRGESPSTVIFYGYIHHSNRLQRMIEDISGRAVKLPASSSEAARLKATLAVLVEEREQNSEDFRAFRAPPAPPEGFIATTPNGE